jgi:hypothetical protein
MLGFSMIMLSLLIVGIYALFLFAVVATSVQYELARRDERKQRRQNFPAQPSIAPQVTAPYAEV